MVIRRLNSLVHIDFRHIEKFSNLLLPAAVLVILSACGSSGREKTPDMLWIPFGELPTEGIRIYEGSDSKIPLKAWYVAADLNHPGVEAQVVTAPDGTLQRPTNIARENNFCVLVNGGVFRTDVDPPRHVGLLKVDNAILEPPILSLRWNDTRYFVARGALGFNVKNWPEIRWVSGNLAVINNADDLPRHELDAPDIYSNLKIRGLPWQVSSAMGGGPVLVVQGKVRITATEEAFWTAGSQQQHPRTAVGYTADHRLILLVVDGRQIASRGVTLNQLAHMMVSLGCIRAMNLDGGGSTALVVDGSLINRPEGGLTERPIMSAIALICDNNL